MLRIQSILTLWQARKARGRQLRMTGPKSHQYVRLHLESLERRVLFTTRTWTGAAAALPIFADNHWSNPNNWDTGAPQAGDDLVFPKNAVSLSNYNDFSPGTSFNSITIVNGGNTPLDLALAAVRAYHLEGNAITLTGGSGITEKSLFVPPVVGDHDRVDLSQITLGVNLTFYNDQSIFDITSAINLSTFTLTLGGPSGFVGSLDGQVSGTGSIVKTGIGAWTITHDNTYTGETDVQQGTLNVSANFALGDTSGDTVVSAGATLSAVFNNFTVAEPLVLNGSGGTQLPTLPGALAVVNGNMRYTGTITLDSDTTIFAKTELPVPDSLTISGMIITNGFSLTLAGDLDTALTGSITGGGQTNQNTPDTFSGTGTTDGPIAVNTGMLSPGMDDTGTLTAGDVTFQPGTTFHATLGHQKSSELVAHSVDLGSSALTVSETADYSASANGFTIIQSTEPISDNSLEGTTITNSSTTPPSVYIRHYTVTRLILFPAPVASQVAYSVLPPVIYGNALQVVAQVIPQSISTLTYSSVAPLDAMSYGVVSLMEGSRVLDTEPIGQKAEATLSASGLSVGPHTLQIFYTDPPTNYYLAGNSMPFVVTVNPPPPPSLTAGVMVTGSDAGVTAKVKVYAPNARPLIIMPYGSNFTGGVRVAVADLLGDGHQEILTAPGPGMAPEVHIYDMNGILQGKVIVFASTYSGGVYLAAGDVNGDHKDDLIVGKDVGNAPKVKVFSGPSLLSTQWMVLANFFAYRQNFLGGVRVAAADMNGDNIADIITAPGPEADMGPLVKIFDGVSIRTTPLGQKPTLVGRLNAFDSAFTGGVYIAAGDVTGDGRADLIAGMGVGSMPTVNVFDGTQLQGTPVPVQSFTAYDQTHDSNYNGGVRVGWLESQTGTGPGEILLAPGQDADLQLTQIKYESTIPILQYLAYPSVATGVFIGGG